MQQDNRLDANIHIAHFPRRFLAHLPTPLEKLEHLSKELKKPKIWIKRDNYTGLSTKNNKTRKLEFLMAEAELQGADIVITQNATQSNHTHQTAAFAAKIGMRCHVLLEDRTRSNNTNYNHNGNVLLDHLHGATTEKCTGDLDMNAEMEAIAKRIRAAGKKIYTIPGGGSNPTGTLSYVNCAFELVGQANDRELKIDHIIHTTGSASTQTGLIIGLKGLNTQIPLLNIRVRAPKDVQENNVYKLACATAEKLNCPSLIMRDDVIANTDYIGKGYGIPTESDLEAIRMFAELESILLDPVYSAKDATELINLIRKGRFKKDERVVFLHTGGSAALFDYDTAFDFQSR